MPEARGRRDALVGLASLALLLISAVAWFASPAIYYPIGGALVECQACRIIYFHVPSAWVAYLAFFVVFVASIQVLRGGAPRWDVLARSSAEVGLVFTTLALLTGALWGKPIWGTWWAWDARMTTTLILWFIYLAYLMLRGYVDDPRRGSRYAAVLGVLGFVDVPINYLSVTWWRTLHPDIAIARVEGPAMPAFMVQILTLSLVAFTLLYGYLLLRRMVIERLQHLEQARALALEPELMGQGA
jgi:heme exporter protein C